MAAGTTPRDSIIEVAKREGAKGVSKFDFNGRCEKAWYKLIADGTLVGPFQRQNPISGYKYVVYMLAEEVK